MINKITYLDGARMRRALIAGANNVLSRQEYLNKINVFPVPDGDTGTNMAFTLSSILDKTSKNEMTRVDDMLAIIADAALDGARGNSGVILAQFFQGLSDGAAGCDKMTPESFSKAIQFGSEYARDALSEPKEGTILTVLTDFSNQLIKLIKNQSNDFEQLLEGGIKEAEKSLENTPNLLAVLKKAGVVDAGAQGFVDLLHGIFNFIKNGDVKGFKTDLKNKKITIDLHSDSTEYDESKFRYCTECIIKGNGISHQKLREELVPLGDSLVVAGNKTKAKVHIHSNSPSEIYSHCSKFGNVEGEKADDMWKQQATVSNHKSKGIAIVTDTGADLPEDLDLDIHTVPVRYNFGDVGYIDKISQTAEEFYNELSINPNHPQTSQPTPGDFRRQYQFLKTHYESIISVHLPKVLSGTFQSATNASKRLEDTKINVIDGLSASVGLGLIVMKIAHLAKSGKKHEEIIELLPEIISQTDVYLIVKDLTYIVRGGRLPAWVKKIADILNLRPILNIKNEGNIGASGAIFGTANFPEKFSKTILGKMDPNKSYNISIAHSNALSDGEKLSSLIQKGHNNINSIYVMDLGCALGIHAGPGSLAASIQIS